MPTYIYKVYVQDGVDGDIHCATSGMKTYEAAMECKNLLKNYHEYVYIEYDTVYD